MSDSHAIMTHPLFDHSKKTVLYIHGYVEAPSHQSVHVIVDAYLTRDDYNCLVLDWAELADGNFFIDALPNIKQVSFCFSFCFFPDSFQMFYIFSKLFRLSYRIF